MGRNRNSEGGLQRRQSPRGIYAALSKATGLDPYREVRHTRFSRWFWEQDENGTWHARYALRPFTGERKDKEREERQEMVTVEGTKQGAKGAVKGESKQVSKEEFNQEMKERIKDVLEEAIEKGF
ncbi:hypothetical protein DPSP01_002259 [Paraphaeosphaeria sporulosa]